MISSAHITQRRMIERALNNEIEWVWKEVIVALSKYNLNAYGRQ